MVSTFGSLAASPLPRAMLFMAAKVHARRCGRADRSLLRQRRVTKRRRRCPPSGSQHGNHPLPPSQASLPLCASAGRPGRAGQHALIGIDPWPYRHEPLPDLRALRTAELPRRDLEALAIHSHGGSGVGTQVRHQSGMRTWPPAPPTTSNELPRQRRTRASSSGPHPTCVQSCGAAALASGTPATERFVRSVAPVLPR
jgi:hypothetical protein